VSRNISINRWNIASRVLAALVGGYAVAYAVTAFLAVYLPLARPDRVVFSSLVSFAVWTAVVIYVFAARSATRVWLLIVGVTAVLCLAAFFSGDWRVRP
jgi:ABC-type Fe3+-siderophore transport system permease subunit